MKIMLMGYAEHGKTSVAQLIQEYGISSIDSSLIAAETVIYPAIGEMMGYDSPETCHADRRNHRPLWYELIKAYNHLDKAALTKDIFARCDMYVGIRNTEEFNAAKKAGLFDIAIWVDASNRLPIESEKSCSVHPGLADVILDNNGTFAHTKGEVAELMKILSVPLAA